MKKSLTVILLVYTFFGCSSIEQNVKDSQECFNTRDVKNGEFVSVLCDDQKDSRTYQTEKYSINLPGDLFKFRGNRGNTLFSSEEIEGIDPKLNYSVDFIETDSTKDCDYYDVRDPVIVEDKENDLLIMRGRADREPEHGCGISRPTGALVSNPVEGAHLFCSVHDGKEVSVCVRQETDDYNLANDILDTFRWDGVPEETMQSLIQESRQKLDEYESTHERRVYQGSAPHG